MFPTVFRTGVPTATPTAFSRAGNPGVSITRALGLRLFAVALSLLTSCIASAQGTKTFSTIYTFPAGWDGTAFTSLVQDRSGNLYGTTSNGGDLQCEEGCGTVFKLDPATGTMTTLYAFTPGAAGQSPNGLIRDSIGNLYGCTSSGGPFDGGAVFKISPAGVGTVLHTFTRGADGAAPEGLVEDAAGNLYGITGLANYGSYGVVFKIDPNGIFTVLHTFAGPPTEGSVPLGTLLLDSTGNLYGTTYSGGSGGWGTVFKLDPAGTMTILHNFDSGMGGSLPGNGVVQDVAGNFYGSASYGGVDEDGTIFKLDPAGVFTVLHSFTGGIDGAAPGVLLLSGINGDLYGITQGRGINGPGSIFKMDPSTGAKTLLHFFNTSVPGSGLIGRVLSGGTRYELFGTTANTCETCNPGTVYQITLTP